MTVVLVLLVGVTFVLGAILLLRVHALLALMGGALLVEALNGAVLEAASDSTPLSRVAEQLGRTTGQLAILIIMASVIGRCMLQSGAADRIVRFLLRALGIRRAPLAFLGSGFLLGIPVFFDTVFYLMIPLGKALRARTGRDYLLYVLTIVAGATMAHSLVPPTPGPLFVAEELGVDLGKMILMGMLVGLTTLLPGYLYARWINRRLEIPLRDTPDLPLSELDTILERSEASLPRLPLAILPVLLPVVLIATGSAVRQIETPPSWTAVPVTVVAALSEKNAALTLGGVLALITYLAFKRPSRSQAAVDMRLAVTGATTIILITAAGGAFGAALRNTGIASLLQEQQIMTGRMLLPLAFLITTAVRTAQGSATVAMITAVGIVKSVIGTEALPYDPVYLALAIGCGSKPFAWMNDSGFWVITTMSGLEESEALKSVTPMTALMGFSGLLVTVVLAAFVPWPFGSEHGLTVTP